MIPLLWMHNILHQLGWKNSGEHRLCTGAGCVPSRIVRRGGFRAQGKACAKSRNSRLSRSSRGIAGSSMRSCQKLVASPAARKCKEPFRDPGPEPFRTPPGPIWADSGQDPLQLSAFGETDANKCSIGPESAGQQLTCRTKTKDKPLTFFQGPSLVEEIRHF